MEPIAHYCKDNGQPESHDELGLKMEVLKSELHLPTDIQKTRFLDIQREQEKLKRLQSTASPGRPSLEILTNVHAI